MSYILDALKKSEKERQRGQLPDILTFQDIVAERPARHRLWAYLLGVALILNAGILIWQVGFSSNDNNVSAKPVKIVQMPAEAISDPKKSSTSSSKRVIAEIVSAPTEMGRVTENVNTKGSGNILINPKETEQVSGVPENTDSQYLSLKKNDSSPMQQVRKEETSHPSTESKDELAGLDRQRIYRFRELPVALRELLPPFAISALMYSEIPSSRMVRVNNEMMNEGQEMAAGLKLDEIVNDGVVFRYRDAVSFWVGVK
jgi:general secretion pathway protein B